SQACDSEAEAYELLDELVARKLIVWTLESSALVRPDRRLRELLERMPHCDARDRALSILARMEAARLRVEKAAGSVDELDSALTSLDATFTEITGKPATRRAGETYAARTLVYEDCVRDLEIQIGSPVLERISPVLALLGHSARWFTF